MQNQVRTNRQNRSLHLYMQHLADSLNDSGLTIQKTLRSDADVPWSPVTIKELLIRPLMKAQFGVDSTTKLSTKDIDGLLDTVTKYLGENHGVHVPFPSMEELLWEQRMNERKSEQGVKENVSSN